MRQNIKPTHILSGIVGLSLLLHAAFALILPQNNAAVLLIASLQIGVTGALLSRGLGLLSSPHPVVRLALILTCGLIPLIGIGALFRFFQLPIAVYMVTIHAIMFIFSRLSARRAAPLYWRMPPVRAFLWGTTAVCVAVLLVFTAETNRYRYEGELSDRGLFASLTEWLINGSGDEGLFNRAVGQSSDFRLRIDGWTYMTAAWVGTSHGEAYQYVWYQQSLMLVWMIPVILFALTYQLTRSDWAAAMAVALLTVFAIHTTDVIGFMGIYQSGRHPVFDLRTLREIGLGVLLPMSLFALVVWMRNGTRGAVILIGLCAAALASVHPRALLVFMLFIAVSGLVSIAQRRLRLTPVRAGILLLCVGILGIAALVLIRTRLPEFMSASPETAVCTSEAGSEQATIIALPLIGETYFLSIPLVFAHGVLVFGEIASLYLAILLRTRRMFAFYAAPALIAGALIVSPVLFKAVSSIFGINLLIGDVCQLGLPFVRNILENLIGAAQVSLLPPVMIGAAAWALLRRSWRVMRTARMLTAPVVLILLVLTLFEPVPIPYSARDQLRTMDDLQAPLAVDIVHTRFADAAAAVVNTTRPQRFLADSHLAATVIQQIPNALTAAPVSGAYQAQTTRFFNLTDPPAPFLDARDIEFLQAARIDYVILESFDTRYPQMILDTTRFALVLQMNGIALFRVVDSDSAPEDALFAQMNNALTRSDVRTWVQSGITAQSILPIIDLTLANQLRGTWDALPPTPIRTYGLAYLNLLSGQPEAAVEQWRTLYALAPQFVEHYAFALAVNQQAVLAVEVLRAALENGAIEVRLTAARALLTERYFYLLSRDDVSRTAAVITEEQVAWRALTRHDTAGMAQTRIELLMAAGEWSTAAEWITWIAPLELRADQLAMRGIALLAAGDVQAALDTLRVSVDPDWLMPRIRLHADRWENNTAAQIYHMLGGNIAERGGDLAAAESHYRAAVDYGSQWAGRAFLAQVTQDTALMDQVVLEWGALHTIPFPALSPLLDIADTGQLYVSYPAITRTESETMLEVSARFGTTFEQQYPVRIWTAAVGTRDLITRYTGLREVARLIPGALVTQAVPLQVPPNLPSLSPAMLLVQAQHNPAVIMGSDLLPFVLNRPESALIPPDAVPFDAHFADSITLTHARIVQQQDGVEVTLYWQANQPPTQDYQVSVQVRDLAGNILDQQDNAPVGGQYPTSQWRLHTTIEDGVYQLSVTQGVSSLVVLLYSLDDFGRLPVRLSDQVGALEDVRLMTFDH